MEQSLKKESNRVVTKKAIGDELTPNNLIAKSIRKKIKSGKIQSPNHLKMPYKIKVNGRTTYYFLSKKKYLNKYRVLRRDYTEDELKVSHPGLCMQ